MEPDPGCIDINGNFATDLNWTMIWPSVPWLTYSKAWLYSLHIGLAILVGCDFFLTNIVIAVQPLAWMQLDLYKGAFYQYSVFPVSYRNELDQDKHICTSITAPTLVGEGEVVPV